jgi:DNA-binding transcriptional LysR family regulator
MDDFHADLEVRKRPSDMAPVAVAAGPSFTKYRLLPLLHEFHRRRPAIPLTLRAGATPEDVPDLVRRGEVELGFVVGPVPSGLGSFMTGADYFVLVAPPGHPVLKVPRQQRLAYLASTDFAISLFSANSRHLIEQWTKRLGVDLRVTIETANLDTLKAAVVNGMALAILPDFAIEEDARAGNVVVVDAPGLPIRREMNLVGDPRRPLSFGAQVFLEVFAKHPRPTLPAPQ